MVHGTSSRPEAFANLTFLHDTYRLHTPSNSNYMSETNLAGAGLMILGREKAVASLGLSSASNLISGSEFSSMTPDLNSDNGSWKKCETKIRISD